MTRLLWLLCCALCLMATAVEGYNDIAHQLISNAATDTARIDQFQSVDDFLRTSAGLFQGWHTHFTGASGLDLSPLDWLALGSVGEDVPHCRSARHFHDPLRPWESAGLETAAPSIILACGSASFSSSIVWGQNRQQEIGEQQSWWDAKGSYVRALTGLTEASRREAWASTFRSLGQVMHLVADASVPEHVRNDSHILETAFRTLRLRGYGSYEWWVEEHLGIFPFSTAPPFDRSILLQPANELAPAAIARLIDTDAYSGAASGPGVTLAGAIGIAEFANANFFSEDTGNRPLLGPNYPFPALDLLAGSQHPAPHGAVIRKYYRKGNDGGVPVDPVLAECVFDVGARTDGLSVPGAYNCVDENVWRATADQMVPRAVDYAAGVLEYFFRGKIEIAPPDRFAYGLANYQMGNAGAFTKLRFKVRNATPGESTGPGQLIAVIQYRKPLSGDVIVDPFVSISPDLFFAISKPIDGVTLAATLEEFSFDFTDSPIPTNSGDIFLTVVYKGQLGREPQAVMLGGKDLLEPDPVDIGNATDWECFLGTLYEVANLTEFPAYLPPAQRQRDVNRDNIQDLFGPSISHGTFVRAFDPAGQIPLPSAANFDFSTGEATAPKYGRFLLLQERESYGIRIIWRDIQDAFSTSVHSGSFTTSLPGVHNSIFMPEPGKVGRRISPSVVYRGVPQMHGIFMVNGSTPACASQTYSLEPDLIRIDGSVSAE